MVNLKKICDSPLNLKIISFFHENPSTVDTARGIATWLDYNPKQVRKALDYLVSQNILIAHRTGSTTAYGYVQDKEIIAQIEKILQKHKARGGKDV